MVARSARTEAAPTARRPLEPQPLQPGAPRGDPLQEDLAIDAVLGRETLGGGVREVVHRRPLVVGAAPRLQQRGAEPLAPRLAARPDPAFDTVKYRGAVESAVRHARLGEGRRVQIPVVPGMEECGKSSDMRCPPASEAR
ncbi:hypothetical protein [Streptomyces violaceusniger]|uniref:Uncharacterized protein n=1 Tax=Streptomyces violaceusniger TaxID=68280 RepID=A0A4D4L4Q6_STRVO|nr:hypothetical protein SVIO_036420 [Streptomyces violaceusniger]